LGLRNLYELPHWPSGISGYTISNSKEIPMFIVGLILVIAGCIIHFTSVMTLNSYKAKLKANEKVIAKLEKELDDPQQSVEDAQPLPRLSGAGKARKIILWSFFAAEILMGLVFIFK